MKSFHLFIALIFAVLAFQAHSLRLNRHQESLSIQSTNHAHNRRLGFNTLLKAAQRQTNSTQAVSNVLKYYIDGTTYFNYIQSLFCKANTEGEEYITLDQFYAVTDEQGIHRVDAQRVAGYIGSTQIDAYNFNQAIDLLFAESMSMVTFIYITNSSAHSRHTTVTSTEVSNGLVSIFNLFKDIYPLPDCGEIEYLFSQCDRDQDGALNLQEFHVFLTIYLRYYKSGIQNNKYAALAMNDKVFEYVFDNQDGLGGKTDRTNFLRTAFKRFLQMTIYDKILNQMSHLFFTKFDSDGSGSIDPQEFRALLQFFHAPEDEVSVLFVAADTDNSGQVDFSEFVVALTTLLRKLVADFGHSFIKATGGDINVEDSYAIFHYAEVELDEKFISAGKFREIWDSVNIDGKETLDEEEFAVFVSEVISYIRSKVRDSEDAEISAVAGIDIEDTSVEEILTTKEEAGQQVSEVVSGLEDDELVEEILNETGATYEELQEVVEEQIGGASIEEVIETVAEVTTEEIIDAVATVALEEIETTDCPTREEIVEAIGTAIESGVIEAIVEETEQASSEEILENVTEVIASEQVTVEATATIELGGEVDTAEIIEGVEASTGEELTTEEIVEVIQEAIGAETAEEVVEVIENSTTEEIIEAVTEAIEEANEETAEEVAEIFEEIAESSYEEAVIEQIEEGTGLTYEEVQEIVQAETGVTLEEAIEAATEVTTEELVEVIAETILEEAESEDCPTPETIKEAIEEVIENGAVEEIIEEIEEASPEEILEAVNEAIKEIEHHEEIHGGEESGSEGVHEDNGTVEETIEEETGYTGAEIEVAVEEQIGGATIEEVIEAVEEIATEEVIEAVTEAVIEETGGDSCITEVGIEEAIEEVIEGGVIEEIVEEIGTATPEEIIEAVTEVVEEHHGGDHEESEESDHHEEVLEEIIEDTGYTSEEVKEIIEAEIGGATIEEVIEAAEEIATEEVIEAVTEAVIEEAGSADCVTEEGIAEAIQEVIEDGAIEEIVEEIQDASPEEVVETVTEVVEEHHEEAPAADEPQPVIVEDGAGYGGYYKSLLRRGRSFRM